MELADDHSLLIVFIEDIIAYQNLDEILEVEHIDIFFVAPGDFAASMGHKGIWDQVANIPEVAQTMEDTFHRINAAGKIAGATCGKAGLQRYLDLGAKFFLTTTQEWLNDGAASFMNIVKNH